MLQSLRSEQSANRRINDVYVSIHGIPTAKSVVVTILIGDMWR